MFGFKRVGVSAVLLAGTAVTATAEAPLYVIKDLTPTGYTSSVAYDINSDGDAVGIADGPSGSAYFFYDHSAGASTPFGVGVVLPRGPIVGTGFRQAAINDDGLIAGTARFLGGVTESRGFIYNGSTFTNLGVLAGATATGIRPASDALDINGLGVATGTATSGAGTIPSENDNIDIYTGTASPISDIDGDITVATRSDFGRAINEAGLVVGQNQDNKATLFNGATETVLLAGTADAADSSIAFDLNELGQVAVENSTDSTSFVYESTGGTVTQIPQIGTGNRMFAKAINESGDVVGQGDRTGGVSGQARGFLYDASEGASIILEDRVVDKSVPAVTGLGDWERLRTAWGINDDGWIVGEGERRFDGNAFPTNRAYLLIPTVFGTGDYNASGLVDQADLDLVLLNWGDDASVEGVPTGWINDQPTGLIGQTELDKVLLNWGGTSEPGGSSVPEPGALTLVGLGALGLMRRR